MRVRLLTMMVMLSIPANAQSRACPPSASGRTLAHPVVTGTAGPFRQVRLTITQATGQTGGQFTGYLQSDTGLCLTLPGPENPNDFFIFDVKAVLFTPLDHTKTNGVAILYDSSQIGPEHGTERRALVYRILPTTFLRQPVLEQRLHGASNAAEARRRLARVAG